MTRRRLRGANFLRLRGLATAIVHREGRSGFDLEGRFQRPLTRNAENLPPAEWAHA
jgi:hypothetical protein